ncbi:hypothetical protein RND81_06G002100 [Saponaria officinalis]|uniref:Homeobox-leucine zipper protein n=1 Tax=Saponaria officinalis TaxID=3572 RepID=A0AAW1K4W8_SAPOF
MKRLGSSDSLGALISLCPVSEEHSPRNNRMYSLEYQSLLDGLEKDVCMEESGHIPEKKRRLSVEQVKALEKYFEVENKLEPERKVKLAQELGLQPRQVAVWFQNRRARWKTRQLERDYTALKASFDSLKQNYDSLQHDKDTLLNKIKVLKSKLNEGNTETDDICLNGETKMCNSSNNTEGIEPITPLPSLSGGSEDAKLLNNEKKVADFKDGPSESDSSAILNEGNNNNSPNASNSSCGGGGYLQNEQQLLSSSSLSSIKFFNFTHSKSEGLASVDKHNNNNVVYHPEYVKLEEHDFFSGEEACNIFSDEAAPTLHWYCSDQWT